MYNLRLDDDIKQKTKMEGNHSKLVQCVTFNVFAAGVMLLDVKYLS